MAFDWDGLEADFTAEMEGFARACLARGERLYAVAAWLFYAETGGVIDLPIFAAASEEWFAGYLAQARTQHELSSTLWEDLRWNPADWPFQHEDIHWSDPQTWRAWSGALTAEAAGDEAHWDAVHERFLELVTRACRAVAERLRAERAVPEGFVVVAMDEAEELVPRSLDPAELEHHFPHLRQP
jgi:hypothetical protein